MTESYDKRRLTHLNVRGEARMVDVGGKEETKREAHARCAVIMQQETLRLIRDNSSAKGDVLGTARIAGILAAKKTSDLIPLCHAIALSAVEVHFELDEEASRVEIVAEARTEAKTGVEMEALTAVAVAALTIYDMCKAVDRGMVIADVRLTYKAGGKSGTFTAD